MVTLDPPGPQSSPRHSPCAPEAHGPAGVAGAGQRPSPAQPPRARAGVRVAPGPADAAGRGARRRLRLPRGVGREEPRSPSVLEPGCEAGRACRVSRHKPRGRLLWAQGPGFLRSPGRAGTGDSRSSPAPPGVSEDQREGARGPESGSPFPRAA